MAFFLFPNVQNLLLSYKSFTYHNLEVGNPSSILAGLHILNESQARFRSGNGIAVCPSTVLLACLSSSPRLPISHRATPAASRCATASSHSFLAARRHCWLRFRQANSKSCNELSEQVKRYSSGGIAGLGIGAPVSRCGELPPTVRARGSDRGGPGFSCGRWTIYHLARFGVKRA